MKNMGQAQSAPAPVISMLGLQKPDNAIIEAKMPVNLHEDNRTWTYLWTIPLEAGRKYRFDGWNIGAFPITGGSCGYFTVELGHPIRNATIFDGNEILFSSDQRDLRVTIQDDLKGGGSSVIVSALGNFAAFLPIPIRASLNDSISLSGDRNFVITGYGGNLHQAGTGTVTVNGHLESLELNGIGPVKIRGSVIGDVKTNSSGKLGKGSVTVDGSVEGDVVQEEDDQSEIEVKGDVRGNIQQRGDSKIHIHGRHYGAVIKVGNGVVQVDNAVEKQEEIKKEEKNGDGSGDA